MNALDLLLSNKISVNRPQKAVKIDRLSNDETEFMLTIIAITMEDFKHVQEMNTDKNGKLDEVGMNLMLVTYGVQEFDGRLAENKERIADIKKNYGVSNMQKFVNMLLLPGEIARIVMEITDISGFNDDLLETIKKA